MSSVDDLGRDNRVTLFAVQALLGLISDNMIAVAVYPGQAVILRFWLRRASAETEEDISDAVFELEALFPGENPEIRSEVHIGPPPTDWSTWAGRMIYWAKSKDDYLK